MLFKRIILNEIHIRTLNPINNQQLVAFFGLDFVNEWRNKIDILTVGKNTQLFYNIYFYFLEKLFRDKIILSDVYKNVFSKRYFEKLEMIHGLYVENDKVFIGKKTHEQFNTIADYINYLDSSLMGNFSKVQHDTNKEISKSGYNAAFYDSRKYENWELVTFQLMSKQPTLFPKIRNINTDKVTVESVDVDGFKRDRLIVAEFINGLKLSFSLDDLFDEINIDKTDYTYLKNCFKQLSDNFDDESEYNKEKRYVQFVFKLIKYQIKICNYFNFHIDKYNQEDRNEIGLDASLDNFAYRRGTKEIVNFDPIGKS